MFRLLTLSYGLANIASPLLGLGIAGKYGFEKMFYFFIALSVLTSLGFILLNRTHTKKENQ